MNSVFCSKNKKLIYFIFRNELYLNLKKDNNSEKRRKLSVYFQYLN